MAKKKKTVHWSKLPRAKLISMVKRLELQCAKLKTQLAEQRETRLLNHSIGASATAEDFEGVVHVTQEVAQPDSVFACSFRGDATQYEPEHQSQLPGPFPWEKK